MPKLIDKDELKEAIQKNICQVMCDEPRGCSCCRVDDVWEVIYEMPTVDAEPVRFGYWEWDGDFICSNCGERGHRNKWNYCPNCGAKMQEVEDNEIHGR